eukprot:scaffold2255_cov259-Pinguiococcus_pyrenoidosus.AAC.5
MINKFQALRYTRPTPAARHEAEDPSALGAFTAKRDATTGQGGPKLCYAKGQANAARADVISVAAGLPGRPGATEVVRFVRRAKGDHSLLRGSAPEKRTVMHVATQTEATS